MPCQQTGTHFRQSKFPFSKDQSGSWEFLQTCVNMPVVQFKKSAELSLVSYLCHVLGVSSLVNATICPQQKERRKDGAAPRILAKMILVYFLMPISRQKLTLSGAQLTIESLRKVLYNSQFSFFPETPNLCIKLL